MDLERLQYLLRVYYDDRCSEQEKHELWSVIAQPAYAETVNRMLDELIAETQTSFTLPDQSSADILQAINQATQPPTPIIKRSVWSGFGWWAAAASVTIAIAILVFAILQPNRTPVIVQRSVSPEPSKLITPGGNKALLTLNDGRTITLDNAVNGQLAMEGNTSVIKSADGKLLYDAKSTNQSDIVAVNTLQTPRGGQYQVTLPDGTIAWLNSVSSIRYPTRFVSHIRKVEVTGEVYLEVKPDKSKPFIVEIKGNSTTSPYQVEVLGTAFNIMAYPEERMIKTTLIHGAVKVSDSKQAKTLRPGQQAWMNYSVPEISLLNDADTTEAVAWRNGNFQFNKVDIKTIMRQIQRWYNVDVMYEGKIPQNEFVGSIERSADIEKVLHILDLGEVHFKIEGKKITVFP